MILIENKIEKVEDATYRHILYIIVEDVEHLTLNIIWFLYVLLETQAVVEELRKWIGAE